MGYDVTRNAQYAEQAANAAKAAQIFEQVAHVGQLLRCGADPYPQPTSVTFTGSFH